MARKKDLKLVSPATESQAERLRRKLEEAREKIAAKRAQASEAADIISMAQSEDLKELRKYSEIDESVKEEISEIETAAESARANPFAARLSKIEELIQKINSRSIGLYKAAQRGEEIKALHSQPYFGKANGRGIVLQNAKTRKCEFFSSFDGSEETIKLINALYGYKNSVVEELANYPEMDFITAVWLAAEVNQGEIMGFDEAKNYPPRWKIRFSTAGGPLFYRPFKAAGETGNQIFESLLRLKEKYFDSIAKVEKEYLTKKSAEKLVSVPINQVLVEGGSFAVEVQWRDREKNKIDQEFVVFERNPDDLSVYAVKATHEALVNLLFRNIDDEGRVSFSPQKVTFQTKKARPVYVKNFDPNFLFRAVLNKAEDDFNKSSEP